VSEKPSVTGTDIGRGLLVTEQRVGELLELRVDAGIEDAEVATADEAAVEIARTYLETEAGLDAETASQLVLVDVQTAREVKHVTFDQAYDGHTVNGAGIVIHVVDDEIQGTSDTLTTARPEDGEVAIDEAEAIDTASKAIEGESTSAEAVQAWVEDGDVLHLSWLVTIEATDPVGSWSVIIDGADGSVVSTDAFRPERRDPDPKGAVTTAGRVAAQTPRGDGGDACEAPEPPSACIFLGDPIFGSGGLLDDRRETRDANDYLVGVELQGLDDPGSGRLVGEYVNTESELSSVEPVVESDGTWTMGRGEPGFEAAMAYYWFDYSQREIQDLGFSDIRNESFDVVPVDPDTVDNAYYSPYDQAVFLGVGSDGINEAEDAAGMTHEYGHAVLDDIAPSLIGEGEAGAYHEGFGDVFAFLTLLEYRTGVGELDAGCLFAWTEELNCLRRVDEDLVYPDDREFEVHQDGRIWAGAVWDVVDALLQEAGLDGIGDCPGATGDTLATCDEVRDRVLATNLAANYYLTSGMTLPDAAEAFMLANESNFDGADEDLLVEAFASHGLQDGGDIVRPDDEPTTDITGVAVSVDVEHSYRGDLDIDLTVVDDAGEELCATSLFESDIHDSGDNFQAILDVTDTDCGELAPPGPDQRWVLTVADQMPEDVGTILDFSVLADDTEYRAGNVPLPIPDDSRAGVAAIVAGVDGEGPTTGAVEGQPFLSYAITHSYVGDRQATLEVTDSKDDVLCSVPVLEPDASDDGDSVEGDVDVSTCADFLPPSADQTWTVVVRDTAALDVGTVDSMTLDDGDGDVYELPDAPVDIPDLPDAESTGTRLVLEGGGDGQSGGDGPTTMHVEVTHPYQGDLSVFAGVADAEGEVLCEEAGATPDSQNSESDLVVDIDLTSCASRHGFGPEVIWFLQVSDTLAEDVGTLTVAELTLPSGDVARSTDDGSLPVDLPDAEPDGVLLVFDVSAPTTAAAGAASISLEVAHPYAGDLDVMVGVVDGSGDELCSVQGHESDPLDDSDGLVLSIDVSECFAELGSNADATWVLAITDQFEVDEGELVSAVLTLPDGTVIDPSEPLPLAIPDADPEGIVVTFEP
jgi:subtilisin-like proprotein convertase family protein